METYPALLSNLPCVVETHKTHDKSTFYKSNDVGQVLQVFLSRDEREAARTETRLFNAEGFEGTLSSGMTLPTKSIVPRKFVKTRPPGHNKFKPEELAELIKEVTESPLADGMLNQPENVMIESTPYEEVVDFEDWMVTENAPNGISVTVVGNKWTKEARNLIWEHPEILLTDPESETEINELVRREMISEGRLAYSWQLGQPFVAPNVDDLFGSDSDVESGDEEIGEGG